jgi:hypothetical protein
MSDDKNIQDGRDRIRVDAHEDYELSYLEEKLNVDRAAIREAIEQVGNDRAKVEEYLTNNKGL